VGRKEPGPSKTIPLLCSGKGYGWGDKNEFLSGRDIWVAFDSVASRAWSVYNSKKRYPLILAFA
jgi:hypothetical protein